MAATTFCRLSQLTVRRVSAMAVCRRHFLFPSYSRLLSTTARSLSDKKYTDKHEWISLKGQVGTVGISEYAQDKLGEIVYVQLPELGVQIAKDAEAGCLESVKAASELYSPASGKVVQVNEVLITNPNLINNSPLDAGWIFKLELSDIGQLNELMDEVSYKKFIETVE